MLYEYLRFILLSIFFDLQVTLAQVTIVHGRVKVRKVNKKLGKFLDKWNEGNDDKIVKWLSN